MRDKDKEDKPVIVLKSRSGQPMVMVLKEYMIAYNMLMEQIEQEIQKEYKKQI